ncbi:MAG: CDP-alcohol phosphatidyltransferase family protein [Halobacteriota archaeon]
MSLLYRFKPQKDRYLKLIVTHLASVGVTANEVTALGLCLALCSGAVAYSGHLYGGLAFFVASALCDALDGSLARTANSRTEFGLYFDGITDRFSELFFVVGAVFGAHVSLSAFIVVAGAFTLLLARVYGHTQKGGAVPTTFGRPERLALLVGGVLSPTPLNTLLFVTAGLCCVFSSVQIVAQRTALRGDGAKAD